MHHSTTTVPTSRAARFSAWVRGPVTGVGEAAARSAMSTRTRRRMSSLRVNSHTMSSVDRWLDRAAKGRPSSSQPAKENSCPPAEATMWEVTRWAPAPRKEPTADSRMTVGKMSDRAWTSRLREATRASSSPDPVRSAPARAVYTGSSRAARPEVEGAAKTVATIAAVTRWSRTRGWSVPVTSHAARRPVRPDALTPTAMTKAATSSQIVSSPRLANISSGLRAPVRTRAVAAPREM